MAFCIYLSFEIAGVSLQIRQCGWISAVQLVQITWILLAIHFVLGDVQIGSPIIRIESPMQCAILLLLMHMAYEFLWREHAAAFDASNTCRLLGRIQIGRANPFALAKTTMDHLECDGIADDARMLRMMQQCAAQAFGIGACDQTRWVDVFGQNFGRFELMQLFRRALGAKNAQIVENAIDLIDTEVREHIVQHLWKT